GAFQRQRELELVLHAQLPRIHLGADAGVVGGTRSGREQESEPQEAPHQSLRGRFFVCLAASSFFCSSFSFCWSASRSCMARSLGIPVSFWKRSCSFSSSLLGRSGLPSGFFCWSCFCWPCCCCCCCCCC